MKSLKEMPTWRKSAIALALVSIACGPQASFADTLDGVSVDSLRLLSRTRVGRTVFDYTYAVSISNQGEPAEGVTGEVVSNNPQVLLPDSTVTFGNVDSAQSIESTDTFTLRLDRRTRLTAQTLSWTFDGEVAGPAISVISGRVTAPDGTPVAGAMVDASAPGAEVEIALTGANGRFSMEVPAETAFTLNVSSQDYATGVARVVSPDADGTLDISITVAPIDFMQSDVEGTIVETPDGVVVVIEEGDFDLPPGQSLDISIATVDVSQDAELGAFPGAFEGEQGGVITPIASFGTSEISFSSNGSPVAVSPGALVDIQLPIFISTLPDGTPIQVGSSIPVWSLNEETGVWLAETMGTVVESEDSPTGLALAAEVSHFSWWNADIALETGTADVGIGGSRPGRATVSATTTAQIAWGGPSTSTTVAIGGSLRGLVLPAGAETCVSAHYSFNDGTTFTTEAACVTPTAGESVSINFTEPNLVDDLLISASRVAVTSKVGRLAPRISINSLTIESSVTYEGSNLPDGLSLRSSSDTSADLSGRFTQAGMFTTTVTGTDSDGNTSSVEVTYDVEEQVVGGDGPNFGDGDIEIIGNDSGAFYDLNEFNTGAPVVSWSIEGSGPYGVSTIDEFGIIRVAGYGTLYYESFESEVYIGTLTATAANGVSEIVDVLFTPDFRVNGECGDFFCDFDIAF